MSNKFVQLLTRGSVILSITSAMSYGVGLLRDRIFAQVFGASASLDAYNAAFILPDFVLNLFVAGALSAAFIPVFTEQISKNKHEEAKVLTSSILNMALLLLLCVNGLLLIFLPQLSGILVPGFEGEQIDLWVSLTRILLLSPILFSISNISGSILVSHERFLAYGLSPVLYNLGIISGAYFLTDIYGIYGVVIGTIFGALLHLTSRILAIKLQGGRFFAPVILFPPEVKKVLTLMLPKMVGLGVWQLHLMAFTSLVSTLAAGSIVVYSFARNFQSVPVSLIGIAIATAAFPVLSKHASLNEAGEFRSALLKRAGLILLFTVPAAICMAVIGPFLIDLLLGGGKFDAEAVKRTSEVLAWYCLAIPVESLMHLLSRAFYAKQNTLIPVSYRVLGLGLAVMLAWKLVPVLGIIAIPISFASGIAIEVVLLALTLPFVKLPLQLR